MVRIYIKKKQRKAILCLCFSGPMSVWSLTLTYHCLVVFLKLNVSKCSCLSFSWLSCRLLSFQPYLWQERTTAVWLMLSPFALLYLSFSRCPVSSFVLWSSQSSALHWSLQQSLAWACAIKHLSAGCQVPVSFQAARPSLLIMPCFPKMSL